MILTRKHLPWRPRYPKCRQKHRKVLTTNTVKDGETDHITVIPDVGYSVGSININGTPSGYYGSFDLTEIHMDTVIHIEFVPMQTEEEAASDNEE